MSDFDHAVQRLTAWLRDYGDAKPKVFIGDVTMVLLAAQDYGRMLKRLEGIDVKKCECCGGLIVKVATPLCGCNVPLVTGVCNDQA